MKNSGLKLSFNILIFPTLLLLFFSGRLTEYILAYACAALHEIAHIVAAKMLKIEVKEVELLPVGLLARMDGIWKLSPENEVMLHLAGPMLNLLVGLGGMLVISACPQINGDFSSNIIIINFVLAVFNLLPILPFDGSKVFMAAVGSKTSILKTAALCVKLSRILGGVFLGAFILAFLFTGNFISILIGIYILGFVSRNRSTIIADALLCIFNKEKLIDIKKIIHVKTIAVKDRTTLIELVKEVDRISMLNVMVYNDNNRLLGTIDELKIIRFASNDGKTYTAGELLDFEC